MKKNLEQIETSNQTLLSTFYPQGLWQHFSTLCLTPRDSRQEEAMAETIMRLALDQDLSVYNDEFYNILVSLDPTPGFEHLPSICLQSHIDMVCVKDDDVESVFPVELILADDGHKLTAKGTTLGADNGIGVATMMTLMSDSTIDHGPLELLFTTMEEIGLLGAEHFNCEHIQSKIMINLDSEEEGKIFIGCAGGGRVEATFIPEIVSTSSEGKVKYVLSASGFIGGHSGIEIGFGRANAIKVLSWIISKIRLSGVQIELIDFTGGTKMNAIPNSAKATILISEHEIDAFGYAFDQATDPIFNNPGEFPLFSFSDKLVEDTERVFSPESLDKFLSQIANLPDGVISWEPNDASLVQTSNNVGVVTMDGEIMKITSMFRSSLKSDLDKVEEEIHSIFHRSGAQTQTKSKYSPWEPQFNTKILNSTLSLYAEMFNKEAEVVVIHAGLECATLFNHMPGIQIISFGPEMKEVHTTGEWVDIASVGRFWDFLIALLARPIE